MSVSAADLRASFFRKPWVRVRNTSSEAIAPYSVMRIVGATEGRGEIVYTVGKPNATSYDWYLVNGPARIPGTGETALPEGWGTFLTTGGYVRYTGSTPTLGETWGPSNGSWEISTGNTGFYITGGVESVAGNSVVTAIQMPSSAGSHHAMAMLTGGTLSACDTNPTSILDPAFAGMPSQTADIYLPASDGTWDVSEEDATIFNPKPFRYGDDASPLFVEKHNGLWLVTRAHLWTPIYRTSFDGSHTSGNNVTWDGSPLSKGNIASEAGTVITIEAPVPTATHYWEVEYGGSVDISAASSGHGVLTVELFKNGAGGSDVGGATSYYVDMVSVAGTYSCRIPFHCRNLVELEEGDELTLQITTQRYNAGLNSATGLIVESNFSIKPLFGY